MFKEVMRIDLNHIIDVSIIDKGVAFIVTAEGDITLKNVPKCIEKVIQIISKNNTSIYLLTKHYGSDERFIDIISLEGRK